MRLFRFGAVLRLVDLSAILILLLTLASVMSTAHQFVPFTTFDEKFDARLSSLTTVEAVTDEVRRRAPGKSPYTLALTTEELLRYRFYHGYSRYDFRDNWVLWIAARFVNPDLDAKVLPDDILKQSWAACSQQGIVTEAVLHRLGIPSATVEWPAHFTAAAYVDNDWYVVDPWGPLDRDRSRLWRYSDWVDAKTRAHILGPKAEAFGRNVNAIPPRLTNINEFPAPTMAWFHPLTKALSDWLWVLMLAWAGWRIDRWCRASGPRAPIASFRLRLDVPEPGLFKRPIV